MRRNPLVLSGPPGVGKSTLLNQLEDHGFQRALLTVSRPPREGEIPGVDLEFLDMDVYEEEAENGAFFMDNRYFNAAYGIRRSAVDTIFEERRVPILTIYMPVIDQFLREYPDSETVYMLPTSIDFLGDRLSRRPQSSEEFQYRLGKGLEEVQLYFDQFKTRYKHELIVDNDDNTPHIEVLKSLYGDAYRRPEGNYLRGKEW